MLTDERIREIYLSCGFTVKPGQTDLKPYVFESARAIEAEAIAPLLQRIAELEQANEAFANRQEWRNELMVEMEQRLSAAPVAQPTNMVRFCPECGYTGPVPEGCINCCPDGSNAALMPINTAKACAENFRAALSAAPAAHADIANGIARIHDLLMCDDGQAYKEARKWVEQMRTKYGIKEQPCPAKKA